MKNSAPHLGVSSSARLKQHTARFVNGVVVLLVFSLMAVSCAGPVKYHVGVITMQITGKITPPPPEVPPTFILVKKYQRTFIQTTEGYLYHETLSVSQADRHGNYRIAMESGTDKVELQFIIPGANLDSNTFYRTLGVGSMEYDVTPQPNPDWQKYFFLVLKPVLSQYIVNPMLKISPADRLFLGNWMQTIENSFSQ